MDDPAYHVAPLPIDFTSKAVAISLSGATIDAGNVTISAQAQDLSLSDEVPAYAAGFTSSLSGLLAQIPGDIISGATGLDASVTLRGANAIVTLDNATVNSSGAVSITATTDVESNVQAMAVGLGGLASKTGLEISVGYAEASSTVETLITGTTSITAAQDVTISAAGTTTANSYTQASANLIGTTNANAVQIAVAITDSELTSIASVANSASITSTGGNVNVSGTGTTTSDPVTVTTGYDGGKAGVDVSLSFDNATIQSFLNGHITAAGSEIGGGSISNGGTIAFNGGDSNAVDLTNSTLYLPNNGLTTGEEVTYTAQSTVPGPPRHSPPRRSAG